MSELTDILKGEHEAGEKCHICFKEFNDSENRKTRHQCNYTDLYQGAAHNNCNLIYRMLDYIAIVFMLIVFYTGTSVCQGARKKVYQG